MGGAIGTDLEIRSENSVRAGSAAAVRQGRLNNGMLTFRYTFLGA